MEKQPFRSRGASERGGSGSHPGRCRPPQPGGGSVLVLAVSVTGGSRADEGGVSFWLPGTYGSLAAVPGQPGWSIAGILYYTSVSADRDEAFSQGGDVRLGLDSDATLLLLTPSYTLKRPVLGGQASFSLTGFYGNNSVSVDATLTGPGGNQVSGSESDSLTSYGDLYPQASLKWNSGVNNAMVYVTGDIPVGDYDPDRLANIGIGHAAIDAGYGYTYFDTKKERLRRLVARRYQVVRHRTRIKNEVHSILHAHLIPKCPHADLFNRPRSRLADAPAGAGGRAGRDRSACPRTRPAR